MSISPSLLSPSLRDPADFVARTGILTPVLRTPPFRGIPLSLRSQRATSWLNFLAKISHTASRRLMASLPVI